MKANVFEFICKSTDFSTSINISNPYCQKEVIGLFSWFLNFEVCQKSKSIDTWEECVQLMKFYAVKLIAELLMVMTESRNSLYITKHWLKAVEIRCSLVALAFCCRAALQTIFKYKEIYNMMTSKNTVNSFV